MEPGVQEFDLTGQPTPIGKLLDDLWRSRDLLVVLARKDFFVRYRRTSFGLVWAVGLPLIQALVLSVVLRHFVRFKTGGDYTLFVYSGTLCWNYFNGTLNASTASIVEGQEIATKIYFPRAILPLVSVASNLYGFLLSVVVLFILELIEGVTPGLRLLWLVPAVALTVVTSTSFALVLAALQVYFRDLKFLLVAVLIPWFYLTPVFYPLSTLGHIRFVADINPATSLVELFRAATVGADHGWVAAVWGTLGWCAVLLVIAGVLYRRFDRNFVDLL